MLTWTVVRSLLPLEAIPGMISLVAGEFFGLFKVEYHALVLTKFRKTQPGYLPFCQGLHHPKRR